MSTTSENLQLWSTTAADNDDADAGINWLEGQDPGSANNSARAMMATLRKYVKDTDGALTAGGTADALTVTTGQGLANSHLADGLRIGVWAAGTNTVTGVTIAVDGLTAKTIKDAQGNALAVGAIVSGMFLDLAYEAGAGVFCATNINSTYVVASKANTFTAAQTIQLSTGVPLTLQLDEDGAGNGPALYLYRNSASPADSDNIGQIYWRGKDSGGNTTTYATQYVTITDVTDTTEDASIIWQTVAAGTLANRMTLANGVLTVTDAATTIDGFLDGLGSTKGNILYHNGTAWVVLAPP